MHNSLHFFSSKTVLNESPDFIPVEESIDPKELIKKMRKSIMNIKSDLIENEGKKVLYEKISVNPLFKEYEQQTKLLISADLSLLSEFQRKGFFINLYNSLVIHGISKGLLKNPSSILSRVLFYSKVSYRIKNQVFSLNDIENGILRSNQKPPIPFGRVPFRLYDSRSHLLVQLDPRIHFALNCGARSCPPIVVYAVDNEDLLNQQLDNATKSFLDNNFFISQEPSGLNMDIKLSVLFKWYRSDFGRTTLDVLNWILRHLDDSKTIEILRRAIMSKNFKLSYLEYDWSLNT